MQDYIDAQFGGPGKGFYRIVHGPVRGPPGDQRRARWPWSWASRPACRSAARSSSTCPACSAQGRRSTASSTRCTSSACARWSWSTSSTTRCPASPATTARSASLVNARQLPRDRLVLGHAALRARRRREPRQATRSPLPDIGAEQQDALFGAIGQLFGAASCRAAALPPPDHCNSARPDRRSASTRSSGLAEAADDLRPRPHEREGARRRARPDRASWATPASSPATRGRPRTPTRGSTRRAASSRRTPATRPASSRSGASTSAGPTRATTGASGSAPTSTASARRATRAAPTSATR